ncbi:MAG: cyclic nucleotide-binding domain-containing protein [Bdellovibrionales bacterium]|nr:cyclic nucleotide-binding domain-containing protein [Bdellovibrionales bacterium]
MTPNLESFRPKLRTGRVIPQGSRIIFETENPYNQIVLPMALADLVLLCSGQFSVREIVDKVYKKQGAVPFRSMLTAIHLLHQGGFFENGDQLALSPHLQSWMEPRRSRWHLSWRFGQRIAAAHRSPLAFYFLTLGLLLTSIFGLQFFPGNIFADAQSWSSERSWTELMLALLAASSVLQTWRYLLCGIQLLLLTSKAYNMSLRLSPWGVHLHVGDEANDLFENRLYTSMFHISQILASWSLILIASPFVSSDILQPLILTGSLISFWELNPFRSSEGRKLVRALLIPTDRDVISWHFDAGNLLHSINPEGGRKDQDFARLCAIWGVVWLSGSFFLLYQIAKQFGAGVLGQLTHDSDHTLGAWLAVGAWLATLYYSVQAMVEILFLSVVQPYWDALIGRIKRLAFRPRKEWSQAEVLKNIEGLPLFSHFHEQFLEKIVTHSQVVEYNDGQTILRQGDAARELYVLLEGDVEVIRRTSSLTEDWVSIISALSVFGEGALVDDTPRAAQILARRRVTVLCVPVHAIRQVALESQSVRQLEVFRNAIMVNQFFASSPVFRSLSVSSIEFLCSRGTLEYFDEQQTVFKQGERGDSLYLILRGSVDVEVHGMNIKRLRQGSFFGEIALIANIPRTASIIAAEPSVFFKISSDAFWEVLVEHMDLGVFIETVSETRLKEDLALAPLKRASGDS